MLARVALLVLLALPAVLGDCYMQCPRGSNNRLNEANRDRDNGNRIFDSQNNNRGGVNGGTYGRPYYYVGSVLPIDWTNQHSCGKGNNINCEIIIQYYCDANVTRDGLTTARIPDPDRLTQDELYTQCFGGDCDNDYRYGRHESLASYRHCKYRSRNRGLWTSSQDMRGNRRGAIFTRQNNNGNRRGYECPEERDYYPYWHPSVWRDLAILTDDWETRCPAYQAESQNVKGRSYCAVTDEWITQQKIQNNQDPNLGQDDYYGFIPITETECNIKGGVWTAVPSHGIPAPYCGPTPWTRDNHLGFPMGQAHFTGWNWTVTDWMVQESCVLRIRYNMSSAETRWGGEWLNDNSVQDGPLNSSLNANYNIQIPNGLEVEDDDNVYSFRYAAKLPLWEKYGLSSLDHTANFDANLFQANVPTRGYVMSNNPVVDIFGPNLGLTGRVRLRLSVNTNQFSRTFQDRSHVFAIRPRPQILNQPDIRIHNLLVRGKRGNIVQTYPSTEYNFVPDTLVIEKGDFIHFQWTGSNTNPNNNAGQGTQGTDRSNIILLRSSPPGYPHIKPSNDQIGDWKQSYPQRIDDLSPWGVFAGLGIEPKRALARAGIYTPHVDIGPLQVREEGVYNYLCTRNNNFSNRDQKGELHVLPRSAGRTPYAVIDTFGMFSRQIAPSGKAWLRFAPDPLGLTTGSQITIEEDGDLIIIRPFFFDVVPGQQIYLEIQYTEGALTQYYIMQSFSPNMEPSFELGTEWDGGIASASINRGGYYKLDARPNIGAIIGIVIGVAALGALIGGGYWQLKRKFKFGAKKKAGLMSEENTTTNTI